MARSTTNQPMTNNVNDLVIGLMKVSVGDIADNTTPVSGALNDLGAIQGASVTLEATYKEHVSGFPEEEDFKILEAKNIGFKISPEEIGSTQVRTIVTSVFNALKTGSLPKAAVEGVVQKANGALVKFYSNHCALKPELTISTDNDWGSVEFAYEWEYNSAYTNNLPLYKSTVAASARDREYMPITKDPTNLVIGRPKILAGNFGTSATGVTAATSNLTLSADSIGAIQGATLTVAPTFKEHMAGYPEVKDFSMLERAVVEFEAQVEEFATASGGISAGAAATLFDMLLDSINNNQDYYCSLHVIWELADGDTFQIWLPNCKVESSAEITTQQDWSAFPVKFSAQKQTTLGANAPDLIYLLA